MAKKVSLKKSKIQRSDAQKIVHCGAKKALIKWGAIEAELFHFNESRLPAASNCEALTQILFHFNWVGGCEAEAVSLSPPPLLCALLHFYCHRGKSTLASARSFSREQPNCSVIVIENIAGSQQQFEMRICAYCCWKRVWKGDEIWNEGESKEPPKVVPSAGKKVKAIYCTSHLLLRPILCPISEPLYRQQTSATAARDEVPILAASNV